MVFCGLVKSSLIEWPGKISAVLFVGGCNFRCPFCYNRDLVLNYEKLPKISKEEVLKFLKLKKGLLDGIMVTGGEVLIKPIDDLINFIKEIKQMGFAVGIETNGSNPEALKKLIEEKLIDFVAMDVKAPLSVKTQILKLKTQNHNVKLKNKYEQLTGVRVSLGKLKKSIETIKNSGIDYELRTTVAPFLTGGDILEIAKELKGVKKFVLQVFQPKETLIDPKLAKMKFLTPEELNKIGQEIKGYFGEFKVRG